MRLGLHAGRLPEARSHQQPGGRPRQMISHESLCLLNISDLHADVRITVYFSDREPVGALRAFSPSTAYETPPCQ